MACVFGVWRPFCCVPGFQVATDHSRVVQNEAIDFLKLRSLKKASAPLEKIKWGIHPGPAYRKDGPSLIQCD